MEFLPDPLNDRRVKECPLFFNKALNDKLLFSMNKYGIEVPDWKLL